MTNESSEEEINNKLLHKAYNIINQTIQANRKSKMIWMLDVELLQCKFKVEIKESTENREQTVIEVAIDNKLIQYCIAIAIMIIMLKIFC